MDALILKTSLGDKSQDRCHERSKLCAKKDIECFYCHQKGHLKNDCYLWKREQKPKAS